MSLYPTLEDMNVDVMQRAQENVARNTVVQIQTTHGVMYPTLADYMGLELSPETIAMNMPEYSQIVQVDNTSRGNVATNVVAPLSGDNLAMKKAFVTQGIRQLQLCKDGDGKVGVQLRAISNGIFVCLVIKESPAALAGLRFGDQVLEINGTPMAGLSASEAQKVLKKAPVNGIMVAVRDRPFERTVTLHKDSSGNIGFQFKDGKIIGLVKDSSAARNGLLIDHQLVEVNGQNVVGIKDKEIVKVIDSSSSVITLTIVPYSIYKHMIKKLSSSLMKSSMDHTPII